MSTSSVRARFAPAPTGMMHLGNIRTALMNYLFAKQKNGTFILRIEDTDPERNFDPGAIKIMEDLAWLGLTHDEGPSIGGNNAPYFQSERTHLYKESLQALAEKKSIYRCFCTQQDLDKKRERQKALKLPPRYDRTCHRLLQEQIDEQQEKNTPFVWRLSLDHDKTLVIHDLARKEVRFNLSNFSDFPITRQNGTFTFMFANFVDDMTMGMTHIFRGEDHLSNTAGQAALYNAFGVKLPIFWHMPILCNIDGKKLSKRDFGFSLRDLKAAGFLPEAIINYLAIVGGSFEKEIMSLSELAQTMNFDHAHASGQIKYDVEKLKWINKKWLAEYDNTQLAQLCRPYITEKHANAATTDDATLAHLIAIIKTEMVTLADSASLLNFYFENMTVSSGDIEASIEKEHRGTIATIVSEALATLDSPEAFASQTKSKAKELGLPLKQLFWFMRLALMGSTKGPGIHELVTMLGKDKAHTRLTHALDLLG